MQKTAHDRVRRVVSDDVSMSFGELRTLHASQRWRMTRLNRKQINGIGSTSRKFIYFESVRRCLSVVRMGCDGLVSGH